MITALCGLHPSVSRRVIGKSLCGRSIDLLQLGAGDDPVLLCGAFHGMEWLTSLLLLRFTSQMAAALETGSLISDIKLGDFLRRRGVTVIPCVNPDGVEISLHGSAAAGEYRELVHNVSCGDTSRWQANARGVDLNHNFNAGWEALHTLEREQGILPSGAYPVRWGISGERTGNQAFMRFLPQPVFPPRLSLSQPGRRNLLGFRGTYS